MYSRGFAIITESSAYSATAPFVSVLNAGVSPVMGLTAAFFVYLFLQEVIEK